MTEENKIKIKEIATDHFKNFPILSIVETPLVTKMQTIHGELPNIYKKIKDKKLLPETISLDVFMQITTAMLQQQGQMAQIKETFGF